MKIFIMNLSTALKSDYLKKSEIFNRYDKFENITKPWKLLIIRDFLADLLLKWANSNQIEPNESDLNILISIKVKPEEFTWNDYVTKIRHYGHHLVICTKFRDALNSPDSKSNNAKFSNLKIMNFVSVKDQILIIPTRPNISLVDFCPMFGHIFVDSDLAEIFDKFVESNIYFVYHKAEEKCFKTGNHFFHAIYKPNGILAFICTRMYLTWTKFLKINAFLGCGAYGEVFLVYNELEGKQYAMKVINKEKISVSAREKGRLMVERKILIENWKIPCLSYLYYSFQTEKDLFLLMNYISGGELYHHISSLKTSLREHNVRLYAAELALAIGYLHSRGIIYRDMKLENIMLDDKGHIVLTDFGMCKENDYETENDIDVYTFCGTKLYQAPEVISRMHYGPGVDWWSYAIVLHEMLFGNQPFRNTKEILKDKVRLMTTISGPARLFLLQLFKKKPKKRLGFKTDINEIKEHSFFQSNDWEHAIARDEPPGLVPTEAIEPNQSQSNNLTRCLDMLNGIKSEYQDQKDEDFPGFNYKFDENRVPKSSFFDNFNLNK